MQVSYKKIQTACPNKREFREMRQWMKPASVIMTVTIAPACITEGYLHMAAVF